MSNLVFGRVPMAGQIDRQALTRNKPEGIGWDNLGRRIPMFVVLHRMVGNLTGTDQWFANPTVGALTDYGLGTANVDGAKYDGVIMQWNDPRGYRSGWASGPVSKPYGDGAAWVNWAGNRWGVSICNVCGVSIENSGIYTDSLTTYAFGELAHFLAYWFDQFGIAWDKAPIHPQTGISAVVFHQEFTIGTGKICPGNWLMERVQALIDAAKQIMKAYQTGEIAGPVQPIPAPVEVPKPQYAKPVPITALAQLGKDDHDKAQAVVVTEGGRFIYVGDRVRALRPTKRLQYAALGAASVGPDMKEGEEADVWYIFTANDGREYYYSPWATRLLASDFERISDTPAFATA